MIDIFARMRRLGKLMLPAASKETGEAPRRGARNIKYAPRRRPRLSGSSASSASISPDAPAAQSQLDLSSFCSDLETLRESMSAFAMRAASLNGETEVALSLHDAPPSLEDDVAVAVRMLSPRAIGA